MGNPPLEKNQQFINAPLMFLMGVLFSFTVNIVGTFPISELLGMMLLVLFPKQIVQALKQRAIRIITILLVINLVLLFFSNIYNGIGVSGSAKGLANLLFIGMNILWFYILLSPKKKYIIFFLAGLSIGRFLFPGTMYYEGMGLGDKNFFDVFVIPLANPFILIVSYFMYKQKVALLAIFSLYALLCLGFGARSNGFIFLGISLCYFLLIFGRRIPLKAALAMMGSLFIVSFFLILSLGASGALGEDSKQEFKELDGNYNIISIIELIRPEPIVAAIAFYDSPWIGHGSNKKTRKYFRLGVFMGIFPKTVKDKDYIPMHSVILASMVEVGFMGAIIWLYILYLFGRSLIREIKFRTANRYSLIILFACILPFWHIPFSPYGFARYTLPYCLVIALLFGVRPQKEKAQKEIYI